MKQDNNIWIVDFGSQYTQLITRRTRELGFSSVILTVDNTLEKFKKGDRPLALILSGGPNSVFDDKTDYSSFFADKDIPILGICYGMQIIGRYFGGEVECGVLGEYGNGHVYVKESFFKEISSINNDFVAWMSHGDHLSKVPESFEVFCESSNNLISGIKSKTRPILALQFHPEVEHTPNGREILKYFFKDIAKLKENWSEEKMIEQCCEYLGQAKDDKILCAFSGGVDSLVVANLVSKYLSNDNIYCFFVDNGLLRPQDYQHIEILKNAMPFSIEVIDAADFFLDRLVGIDEPEQKRKIIGNSFIEVFEQKVHEFENEKGISFKYLLQGTLYPDVIESISPHGSGGKSVTIKSHHNVGGLPERMNLKLLEPLRFLFKDEVRKLGVAIGLNAEWIYRHPFPGPGIGVRVLGEVKRVSVKKVQLSDQILYEELKTSELYDKCWQAFTVLLPIKTVGVKGDARSYEEVICLRIVNSIDGMTATWTEFPHEFLSKVSSRIVNEVEGITRVVYDITSKPPGTIEWE